MSRSRSPATSACRSDGAICVQPASREFAKQDLNPVLTFPVSFDKVEVSGKVATMGKGRWPSVNEEVWYFST